MGADAVPGLPCHPVLVHAAAPRKTPTRPTASKLAPALSSGSATQSSCGHDGAWSPRWCGVGGGAVQWSQRLAGRQQHLQPDHCCVLLLLSLPVTWRGWSSFRSHPSCHLSQQHPAPHPDLPPWGVYGAWLSQIRAGWLHPPLSEEVEKSPLCSSSQPCSWPCSTSVLGTRAGTGYSRLGGRCIDGHMHFHICVIDKETRKREDRKP